jgi:colicin import membrane protein
MSDNIPTPPAGTEELEPVTPQAGQAVVPETPALEPEPQPQEPVPQPEPTPQPEPQPAPAAPAVPSVEERYRQSSSEAIILNSQKKSLEQTLTKLTSEDTPTEPELLAEFPEYKAYNAVTQKLMRDTLENKKRQMRINLQLIEQDADRRWQADLRTITRKPEYASLKGDEKFEEFVFQPKHRGVEIQTLADAYLVRTGRAQPAQPVTPPANPSPAQPAGGLPRGSGGPRTPNKPNKITLEQAKVIRETNYKEYMRLVRANLIETDV